MSIRQYPIHLTGLRFVIASVVGAPVSRSPALVKHSNLFRFDELDQRLLGCGESIGIDSVALLVEFERGNDEGGRSGP